MRRLNNPPRIVDIENRSNNVDDWFQTATERFGIYKGASSPTAADIPEGQWVVWRQGNTGTIRIYANDGGVVSPLPSGYIPFLPTVIGTTTAGAATYTTRLGYYMVNGPFVFFTINLAWSAHTGTGDIAVIDLPATSLNIAGVIHGCDVVASNLTYTAGKTIKAYVLPNTRTVTLLQEGPSSGLGGVPIDTAVSALIITGFYSLST